VVAVSSVTNANGIVYSLVTIGFQAFRGAPIINCVIPDSVTSIEQIAFYDCFYMTNITLSKSLLNIDGYLFVNTGNLKNLVIPNSVTNIDGGTFYDSGLRNITIGSSVTTIRNSAFQNCRDLTSVVFVGDIPLIEPNNFDYNTQDTVYYKASTYNNTSRINSIVPSIFTYAQQYTGSFIFINPPQNVTGTAGINSAKISWAAVTVSLPDVISKYQVSYYKTSTPTSITTVDVSGNVTQTTIAGLTNDETYGFTVKAFINDTSSAESSAVQVTPFSLNPPQNVRGTAGVNSATISWTAVTTPLTITKYQVSYYNTTTPSSITTVDVSGNITQTTITGLINFETYEFSVKAFVNEFSTEASTSIQVIIFLMNAPQNVTGIAGINKGTISWSAVIAPVTITKYQVSYYNISTPSSITNVDVSGNITESLITGLINFQTYEFSVKAFIDDISSNASSKIQLTPFTIDAPQNVTGILNANSVKLNWTAVTVLSPNTITKYQISYYNTLTPLNIFTLDSSGTLSYINNLPVNQSYIFSVKAFVNTDSSVSSSTVTFQLTINNMLQDKLKNIAIEIPIPSFFYKLVTAGFTQQELLDVNIQNIPFTNTQLIQEKVEQLSIELGIPITYINADISILNNW
jgi:hypothetical protein